MCLFQLPEYYKIIYQHFYQYWLNLCESIFTFYDICTTAIPAKYVYDNPLKHLNLVLFPLIVADYGLSASRKFVRWDY